MILASAGGTEKARAIVDDLLSNHKFEQNDHRSMALIYAALGEYDLAFDWLYKSLEKHEEALCSLKVDPKLDPIRKDPRFNELIRKIGLPVD